LRSNKTRRADVYCLGWSSAVARAVEPLKVAVPEIVKTYLATTKSDLVTHKAKTTKVGNNQRDNKDITNGLAAGRNVDINKPLNGGDQLRLLQ
jgi:hypothetical protein